MTTATPAPVPTATLLDAALGKIDELLAAPVLGVTSMSVAQLQEHTAAELEKAIAEATGGKTDTSKARLEHLKAQVATAKAIYDSGASLAPITMFKDPWQTLPGEGAAKGTAEVPQPAITPTGDSNIQFQQDVVFVQTEKGRELSPLMKALIVVAKATDSAPVRQKLTKAADGAAIIAKAGEAQTILANIAAMFGIQVEGPAELLDYEFKWSVGDTICALQSAAKLEGVMATMSALMGSAAPAPAAKGAVVPPAAPPAPTPAPTVEAWPLDMTTAVLDEKTGLMKAAGDAEGKLYWGRDTEKAPTT